MSFNCIDKIEFSYIKFVPLGNVTDGAVVIVLGDVVVCEIGELGVVLVLHPASNNVVSDKVIMMFETYFIFIFFPPSLLEHGSISI